MSVYSSTIKSTKRRISHRHLLPRSCHLPLHPSTVLVFQPLPGNLDLIKTLSASPRSTLTVAVYTWRRCIFLFWAQVGKLPTAESYCRLFWSQHCPQTQREGKIKEPTLRPRLPRAVWEGSRWGEETKPKKDGGVPLSSSMGCRPVWRKHVYSVWHHTHPPASPWAIAREQVYI